MVVSLSSSVIVLYMYICDCIVVLITPVITASLLCVMCSTDQQTYYGHVNQVSPELRQEVQPHFQNKSTPCFDTRVMCNLMWLNLFVRHQKLLFSGVRRTTVLRLPIGDSVSDSGTPWTRPNPGFLHPAWHSQTFSSSLGVRAGN